MGVEPLVPFNPFLIVGTPCGAEVSMGSCGLVTGGIVP